MSLDLNDLNELAGFLYFIGEDQTLPEPARRARAKNYLRQLCNLAKANDRVRFKQNVRSMSNGRYKDRFKNELTFPSAKVGGPNPVDDTEIERIWKLMTDYWAQANPPAAW